MAKPGSATSSLLVFYVVVHALLSLSLANINFRGDRYVHKFDWKEFDEENKITIAEDTEDVSEDDWETLLPNLERHKRDTSADDQCFKQEQENLGSLAEGKSIHHSSSFGNDTNHGLALTWFGKGNSGNLIVVTTEEAKTLFRTFAKASVVYRTIDGGITFQNISGLVENAIIRKSNGLQRNPHDTFLVYLVAHSTNSEYKIYISAPNGDFVKHKIPFDLEDSFHFHPQVDYKPHILGLSSGKELFITTDNCGSWTQIASDVHEFKWGTAESESNDPFYKGQTIYVMVKTANSDIGQWWATLSDTEAYALKKSTDGGKTWTKLLEKVVSFGLESKFLFASVEGEADGKRKMKVSTDGGNSWEITVLPSIVEEQFYSILDSSEGMIFMHVDNPGDTGHGTLYTSAGKGIIFSESLQKHLYPYLSQPTDFYKVESMRGVYIASQMSNDDSIHSRISYDRGGIWQPIARPEDTPCKDESKECHLQLHNSYSISRGIKAHPPLSVESATGLILAHGHVANAMQTTDPDVYLTSDGGYTWKKTLDGPHRYQVADSGGLIVAVPIENKTATYLKFSVDMGSCWHSYNFTDEPIVFTGLLTEPGSKSLKLSLWGFGETDRIWRVHTVNFDELITRKCEKQDYEPFTAHSEMRKKEGEKVRSCLLGVKETFLKLKESSWCQNGYYHKESKTVQYCPCTREDYECDFAYYRPMGSDKCEKEAEFTKKQVDICRRGHMEELVTQGYRKIPGDKCIGGETHLDGKVINLKEKCKETEEIEIIKQEVKESYIEKVEETSHKEDDSRDSSSSHSNFLIIGSISVALVGLIGVMTLYFVCRYYALRRHQVTYRYSLLNQSEEQDFDGDLENVLTSQKTVYDDSEDEDIETTRPSLPNGRANTSTSRTRPTNPTSNVMSYHDDSDVDMLE